MNKKISGAMVLTLCACLGVMGCGSPKGEPAATGSEAAPSEGGTPRVVGAALLTQTHVFYQDMIKALEDEAAKNNMSIRFQFADFDSSKQNNQIETFLLQGVDALIVAPVDSAGIAPVIGEARAKNVPVFTVDIAAKGAEVTSHIASDNYKGGELLGEYLATLLNGKGNVAIIDHPMVTSVQERTAGFVDALAKHPEMRIVQRVPGEGQRDKAFRATQDLLQANADIDAIFGINDDSALGALAVLEAAGLQDKIVIVGFDGTPEARDAIKKGTALKADAVQYPEEIGRKAIQIIAAHFRGEQAPKDAPVDVGIIDQKSLQESGS